MDNLVGFDEYEPQVPSREDNLNSFVNFIVFKNAALNQAKKDNDLPALQAIKD